MTTKRAHKRRVRIGVVLPAAVELIVGTDDDEPSEDSDWEILSVLSASCEATPRMVEENMHDVDFSALTAAAARAKDQP
jgi:uncharacterized protein (UPF0276 family)